MGGGAGVFEFGSRVACLGEFFPDVLAGLQSALGIALGGEVCVCELVVAVGLDEEGDEGDADDGATGDGDVDGPIELALAVVSLGALAFAVVVVFWDFDARGGEFLLWGLRLGFGFRGLRCGGSGHRLWWGGDLSFALGAWADLGFGGYLEGEVIGGEIVGEWEAGQVAGPGVILGLVGGE